MGRPRTNINVVGQKFGKLIVVEMIVRGVEEHLKCLVKCECGNIKVVRVSHLQNGNTQSCGCNTNFKHGESRGSRTPEYRIWKQMRIRCNNSTVPEWKNYGGRGIKVCKRWETYTNFLMDMGRRPSKNYSLNRIDNDGDYEPINCEWSTRKQQARNTQNTKYLIWHGEIKPQSEIAEILNVDYNLFRRKIYLGWTPEECAQKLPKLTLNLNHGNN